MCLNKEMAAHCGKSKQGILSSHLKKNDLNCDLLPSRDVHDEL